MRRVLAATALAFALATSASAREWQGNMPVPVQPLPKYPPVVCIATNWATEACEDRQTPLPKPNPLRAFALQQPQKPRTVLYDEPGGEVTAHWQRWMKLAGSGDDVEIRGTCASACTLIMAHIPNDRLCFGENATLQFHPSRNANTGEPSIETTKWMINQYPQDIRLWIEAKGGIDKMGLLQMWQLDAPELWRMGYRKCEPEEAPVPMTKRDAMKNYRPTWN